LLETGDRVRVDLRAGRVDALVPIETWQERRVALEAAGGYPVPPSQTPWQELQRGCLEQLSDGMVLGLAVKYQRIAAKGLPRDNH